MSETAKTARNAMKEKAKRLTSADPHTKVDSSTWTPPEAENAGVKTGARPLSKRQFKKGGKVVGKCEGGEAMKRADRKPRKAGGRATSLTPDTLINRDVRMANDVREGTKHVGAFKKGGKTHKADGGATEAQRVGAASSKFYKEGNKPAVQSTKSSDFDAMRNADRNLTTALEQQGYKKGGRIKHASGGEKGGKVRRAEGGQTEAQRVGAAQSRSNKAYDKAWDTAGKWADFSPSGIGNKSNVDLSMDAAKAYMASRDADTAKSQAGMKKGGRAHKFSGGVGQNPVSAQSEQMGKAAGMRKHGGRARKADGGDAIGDMIRQQEIERGMKGRGLPERAPMPTPRPADKENYKSDTDLNTQSYKKGGKAMHPDEAEDKKLIKKMVKPKALRSHKAMGGMSDDHDSHANWMKRREETAKEIAAKKAANPGKSFSQIMLDEVGDLGRKHGEYLKSRRTGQMAPERQKAMAEGRNDCLLYTSPSPRD